ncbi:Serine/threonine-protein kinase haspin-like protein [Armadillidium nasatum]|uniref:Serine/threonine-protein kinase haspin-like protein n=1 Tax=Armadillidium nasatum TaxID=96803 RepID=A0A5N5T0G9_9CRUS|nr:Serine/threonine-protein kinase haspin-like protein [Armadillidium nasatum]
MKRLFQNKKDIKAFSKVPVFRLYTLGEVLCGQKIGEGVFGEVFSITHPESEKTVLKIIPIEGDLPINGERQKTFEEMMPEIVISRCLSNLREDNQENSCSNFVFLNKAHLLIGNYSSQMLKLWDEYDEKKVS